MFLGDFCKLNETCCFTSLFDVIPHSSVSYSFYTHFIHSALLIVERFATHLFNFSGLFYHTLNATATVLSGYFYLQTFFTLQSFSHAGRNTQSRILLSACPHKVILSHWRLILNYSYGRYNTIGLPIAPVSHEVNYLICFNQPMLVQSHLDKNMKKTC